MMSPLQRMTLFRARAKRVLFYVDRNPRGRSGYGNSSTALDRITVLTSQNPAIEAAIW